MSKPNFKLIFGDIKKTIIKRSPEILTGIGIAGMITTTILAVKATPKAMILLEEEKERQKTEKLSLPDTVKTAWFCYISPTVTGALSIACLICASSVNLRRNTALAAAYTLSESTLKEYSDKVVETIGEKKEQAVRDSIAKDKIEQNPVKNTEVILTRKGETLCYDAISGRYFRSDIDKLRKAENILNRRMRDETYISLNEFYSEIDIAPIAIGDDLGWNIDTGYIDFKFSSQLTNEGEPCLVISYKLAPMYGYRFLT